MAKDEMDMDIAMDEPVSFVVGYFDDMDAAKEEYEQLKMLAKDGTIHIEAAAVMTKDEDGKVKVHEKGDMSGKKGAMLGGVAGGALGIVMGAVALPLTLGALIGGVAAKKRDKGFDNKELSEVVNDLEPGTSAITAIVEHTWIKNIADELKKVGAHIESGDLPQDLTMVYGA